MPSGIATVWRWGENRGTMGGELQPLPGASLLALAAEEEPAVELGPFLARFRGAGVTHLYVARQTPGGALVEAGTAGAARAGVAFLTAKGRRFVASQEIEWPASSTPVGHALERLAALVQGFDTITRLRLAATDMRLVAHSARALLDADESDGPARLLDRVIETGMVVSYMRPYLESNEAGIGRKLWPEDPAGRTLHQELEELRNEYHAHSSHTPRRRLEIVWRSEEGRTQACANASRFPREPWQNAPTRRLTSCGTRSATPPVATTQVYLKGGGSSRPRPDGAASGPRAGRAGCPRAGGFGSCRRGRRRGRPRVD
jgi:hypothetical protein